MVKVLRSFCELAASRLATRNWPLVYSILVILPAMGARFTCTSKMFRKMLMREEEGCRPCGQHHLPISGRDRNGPVRNGSIRIAEKIETEERQQEQRNTRTRGG